MLLQTLVDASFCVTLLLYVFHGKDMGATFYDNFVQVGLGA